MLNCVKYSKKFKPYIDIVYNFYIKNNKDKNLDSFKNHFFDNLTKGEFYLYFLDKELIGFGGFKKIDIEMMKEIFNVKYEDGYEICSIFVIPKFRGRGYQKTIIKSLIKKIKSDTIIAIIAKDNTISKNNFLKFNFKWKANGKTIWDGQRIEREFDLLEL